MPISNDEFERGYTNETLKGQIENLLSDCKPRTYNEISSGLGMPKMRTDQNLALEILSAFTSSFSLYATMSELEKEGKIERRYVETNLGRTEYYRKKKCR